MGTRKLKNGGVVYKLNDTDAPKWAFTKNFGGTLVVKERGVSVIIEYMPVAHNPDVLVEGERIEHNSRLGKATSEPQKTWTRLSRRGSLFQASMCGLGK